MTTFAKLENGRRREKKKTQIKQGVTQGHRGGPSTISLSTRGGIPRISRKTLIVGSILAPRFNEDSVGVGTADSPTITPIIDNLTPTVVAYQAGCHSAKLEGARFRLPRWYSGYAAQLLTRTKVAVSISAVAVIFRWRQNTRRPST